MFRKRLLPLVVLGLAVVAGCPQGGGQRSISTPQATRQAPRSPADELKNQLGSLAERGELAPGADLSDIGRNVEALKASDAEKGAALEKDLEELNKAVGNPEQLKATAKRMLDKL